MSLRHFAAFTMPHPARMASTHISMTVTVVFISIDIPGSAHSAEIGIKQLNRLYLASRSIYSTNLRVQS